MGQKYQQFFVLKNPVRFAISFCMVPSLLWWCCQARYYILPLNYPATPLPCRPVVPPPWCLTIPVWGNYDCTTRLWKDRACRSLDTSAWHYTWWPSMMMAASCHGMAHLWNIYKFWLLTVLKWKKYVCTSPTLWLIAAPQRLHIFTSPALHNISRLLVEGGKTRSAMQ